ncbi:hypothetical protein AVEN_47194-1 [Araneus ventricosus]|uniref:C2H2-type domain-containing protein n=1 Tax=Araneus ventricosus TaxID=182803 RepID=A0A4Y2HPG2_ARAVE|nr:hypothetical protein AVEN_47194-1 [Araneus ventricosus]
METKRRGYRRFENTDDQVPVEILPFLKQRPELTIFEKKPAAPAPTATPTRNVRYHCEFCPYESGSIQHFQLHLDSHKVASAHQCQVCLKMFKTASKLQAHMATHEATRSHTCVYCEKKFKTPATLKAHMKTHFQFEQLKCAYCERSFLNESQLKRHMATYHMQ